MSDDDTVTVVIWPLTVSEARMDALRSLLSTDELARADKMRLASVSRAFIVSHGIARELLARRCGCEPHAIAFGAETRGKPYILRPATSLAFSLSHSGGYGALAFGEVARLGVDIEAIRPTIGDLAKNVFTPREAARYTSLAESARLRAFFRGWVAKEAYLKATGEGLAGGLASFELDLTDGPEVRPMSIRGDTAELARWQFRGFDVEHAVVGAIAVETANPAIRIHLTTLDAERSTV